MHPILFYIHNLAIGPYGLLLAVALVLGVALAVRRGRQAGVKDEAILDVAFFGTLTGIAGARITYILTHLEEFARDPLAMILDRAGFQFMGGLVVACLTCVWLIRRHGERIGAVADACAPSLALGHALGRIGCHFAGCCYGSVCPPHWEWAGVRFPRAIDKFGHFIGPPALADSLDPALFAGPYDPHSLPEFSPPVWPTQLLEAAGLFAIFVLLWRLWRRRRFEGQIFAAYLCAYSVLRFLVEFLRGDADRGFFLFFSTSQWMSLLALGIAAWFWRHFGAAGPPPTALEVKPAPMPAAETASPEPRRHRRRR